MLRLVPLHDVRTDLRFGELAHRAAQELLFVGQAKVHRLRMYHAAGTMLGPIASRGMRHAILYPASLPLCRPAVLTAAPASADLTAFIG